MIAGRQRDRAALVRRDHMFPPVCVGGDVGAEVLEQRVGNAAEEVDSDVPDAAIEVGRISLCANSLLNGVHCLVIGW